MQNQIKIGTMVRGKELPEITAYINNLGKFGFESIEITFGGDASWITDITEYARQVRACAEKNGMTVISVVLNSPQMWERSEELLDFSYNNYKLYELVNKQDLCDKIYKDKNQKPFSVLLQNNFSYPLQESEKPDIIYKINGKNPKEFMLNPQKSGVFEIYLKNKLIFSQNIFIII